MSILLLILKIVFSVVCVLLIAIVLLQQGKVSGLSGSIAGAGETYWGKNKARSMEGGLHKFTVVLAVLFIVLAIAMGVINKYL